MRGTTLRSSMKHHKPMKPSYKTFSSMTTVERKQPLDIPALVAPMYEVHKTGENQTYEWRIDNLKKLRKLVTDHDDLWIDALSRDFGKLRAETIYSEMEMTRGEIDYFLNNLRHLMRPKHTSSPLANIFCFSQVEERPLRAPAVLVIGASNYPVHLTLLVAAGPLAAGNPVVIKPSEQTPAVSNLMYKLCSNYFDSGSVQVVEGGKEVATELCKQEWGKLAFTGSERVGKMVARAASETLTPLLLELGGKSPLYVADDVANMRLAAQRIVWGKTFNGGQTCICTDYLLVHEDQKDELIRELLAAFKTLYGANGMSESQMTHSIQSNHAERHLKMILEAESAKLDIPYGGSTKCDLKNKWIHPTLVVNPPLDTEMMKEEIFGPLLPIITVKSRKDAQDFINAMPGIPLAMYVFTSQNATLRDMIQRCPASTILRNDTLVHLSNSPDTPFGGLGTSGYGNYHGIYSWRCFTHAQPQVYRPLFPLSDFGLVRYPTHTDFKIFVVRFLLKLPAMPPVREKLLVASIMTGTIAIVLLTPWLRFGLADILALIVDWLRVA